MVVLIKYSIYCFIEVLVNLHIRQTWTWVGHGPGLDMCMISIWAHAQGHERYKVLLILAPNPSSLLAGPAQFFHQEIRHEKF